MRSMRFGFAGIALVLCAAMGLFAAKFSFAARPASGTMGRAGSATTITVVATEFKFKLSRTSVPVGTVTFKVTNKGKIGNTFYDRGQADATDPARQERDAEGRVQEEGEVRLSLHCPRSCAARHEGRARRWTERAAAAADNHDDDHADLSRTGRHGDRQHVRVRLHSHTREDGSWPET